MKTWQVQVGIVSLDIRPQMIDWLLPLMQEFRVLFHATSHDDGGGGGRAPPPPASKIIFSWLLRNFIKILSWNTISEKSTICLNAIWDSENCKTEVTGVGNLEKKSLKTFKGEMVFNYVLIFYLLECFAPPKKILSW